MGRDSVQASDQGLHCLHTGISDKVNKKKTPDTPKNGLFQFAVLEKSVRC